MSFNARCEMWYPTRAQAHMDLSSTHGAEVIGLCATCAVWGISCVQTVYYFSVYGKDKLLMKGLVLFLWALDTLHVVFTLLSVWEPLISRWGDLTAEIAISVYALHVIWMETVISATVQIFFIRRIWLLSGKTWSLLCSGLVLLTIAQLACAFPYFVIAILHTTDRAVLGGKVEYDLAIALRVCSVVDDILISTSLLYLLLRGGVPQFSRSRLRLQRLVVLTFNTGTWTALFALLSLALFAAFPLAIWFGIFEYPLASIYYCTLMANLNGRHFIQGESTVNEYINSGISGSRGSSGRSGAARPNHLVILEDLTYSHANASKLSAPGPSVPQSDVESPDPEQQTKGIL